MSIHSHWYELPLGAFRSGDLSGTPSCGEEHDAHDTIRIYMDPIRYDAMEFGNTYLHAPTQQKLKIAERVAAYNAGNVDNDALIDKRDEHLRKWKYYHPSVRKYHVCISKASSSKGNNSS